MSPAGPCGRLHPVLEAGPTAVSSWALGRPQETGQPVGSGHSPRSVGARLPSCPSPSLPGASWRGRGGSCAPRHPRPLLEGPQLQPGHSVSPVYTVGAQCGIFSLPRGAVPPPAQEGSRLLCDLLWSRSGKQVFPSSRRPGISVISPGPASGLMCGRERKAGQGGKRVIETNFLPEALGGI